MNEEFFFKWVKVFSWSGEEGGGVTNLSALSHTGMINHSLKTCVFHSEYKKRTYTFKDFKVK